MKNFSLCIVLVFVFFNYLEQSQADEDINSFFEDYQKWRKQKRDTSGMGPDGNGTVNLSWGYKQEDLTYFVSEERVDFYTAFIKCKQMGWDPVTIMSATQNKNILRFLEPVAKRDTQDFSFWIGGQKVGRQFYWLNTGKLLIYNNWFHNYPDNWGGNENCLEILFSDTAGAGWNDAECDKTRKYVCQRRRSSVAFILDFDGLNTI